MPHIGLDGHTPNEVYGNEDLMGAEYQDAMSSNIAVKKRIPVFNVGDTVRIFTERGKFSKEGAKWSTGLHEVVGKEANKYELQDGTRLYKPFELQKVDAEKLIPMKNGDLIKKVSKEFNNIRKLKSEGIVDEAGAVDAVRNIHKSRPARERKAPDRLTF